MDQKLKKYGIRNSTGKIHYNMSATKLIEEALRKNEGILTYTGALAVNTGKYTGRSPNDKFIVDTDDVHDNIAWGNVNVPMRERDYRKLKEKILSYMSYQELYVFEGYAGAHETYRRKFLVINELACQNLFIRQLLVRPTEEELENFGEPDFTVVAAPNFKCVPELDRTHSEAAVVINFKERLILIAGSAYSGEIKKSIFSVMNYMMPIEHNVLPMHCSSNMDPETKETAIFFGLSGTGKTTLSADPNRMLIGDDEHGWAADGIFNFEGGCYAKTINLSPKGEPGIYNAIKFGAELENVVVDPETRIPDYDDDSLTENTRVAYPVEFIDNAVVPGTGAVPKVVIFLTADAFGVLPPISKLSQNAAMYQFVAGFTSKVAGTERGIKKPQPTFSTLFGEPFMPLSPEYYAKMLGERIASGETNVYLVNTGWSGGPYGVGSRMKLSYTRAMVTAALNGTLEEVEYVHDERFNLEIPQSCPDVPSEILNPKDTWADQDEYEKIADNLADMFQDNFNAKYRTMAPEIRAAGPRPLHR